MTASGDEDVGRVAPRKNTSLSTTTQTRDCGDSAPDPLRPTSPANIEAKSKASPRKMKTKTKTTTKLERERNNTIASQSPCFESSSWVVPTFDHDRHHDRPVNRQKQRSPFVEEFDAVKREEERNLLQVVLPEGRRCKETPARESSSGADNPRACSTQIPSHVLRSEPLSHDLWRMGSASPGRRTIESARLHEEEGRGGHPTVPSRCGGRRVSARPADAIGTALRRNAHKTPKGELLCRDPSVCLGATALRIGRRSLYI
ncbi:hypothetical protein HPB47_000422 [Ixodes persulcatus]|uniref:Uncharacterized protein n=1 Tax=Ixodes persulcatus TaxID=34615 RepID=A0AC60PT50_IXOPE|nr:hypothetical protein HPB47_000422 [Ixodes persulcatus]